MGLEMHVAVSHRPLFLTAFFLTHRLQLDVRVVCTPVSQQALFYSEHLCSATVLSQQMYCRNLVCQPEEFEQAAARSLSLSVLELRSSERV